MKKILITIIMVIMMVGLNVKADDIIFSSQINSINGVRYQDYLVYYDYKTKGSSTGTNQYGYEVAFTKDGIAIEIDTNVKIPVDGFVLSGHGNKVDLLKKVKVGDRAVVDLVNKTVSVIRDDISIKMMAELRLNDAKSAKEEAYNNGIIFDEEVVNELIETIENKVNQLKNASSNQLALLSNEVSKLADEVIYRVSKTKSVEVRALWHRPNGTSYNERTLNGIIRLLTKFKDLGFNTIFLETFWNGYASYRSEILETHPRVGLNYYGEEYGYDYVKAFIGEAKKLGIDVHAWLHLFNAGSSEYRSKVVKDEWLVENYQGEKLHPNTYGGSYYYDPSNEEVLDFVESIIVEMATKYEFAGIQYDYVRYYDNNYNQTPIRDSGYGVNAENKFKAAYNLTGNVRDLIKQEQYRSMWNEWRQNNITNAVKRFSKKIHSINPDLIISAAVVSNLTSARNTYMQDWYTWIKAGYIDMLTPMIYTGSSEVVKNDSADILSKLGNLTYLVSGIAPIYYGHSVMTQHNQIQATNYAAGQSIFASQNVVNLEEVESSLVNGRYRSNALNITANPKQLVTHHLNNLSNTLNELHSKRNLINKNTLDIFTGKINELLELEIKNPANLSEVLTKLQSLSSLTLYIDNNLVRNTIKEDIDSLIDIIDIKISRHLINNDYWDPITNATRPDISTFVFDDYDDELPNEPTDPSEPNEPTNPTDPVDEEDNKSSNNIVYYLVGVFSLLIIALINVYYFIFRKKVKR